MSAPRPPRLRAAPLRQHFLETLARRAQGLDGGVRQHLEARLAALRAEADETAPATEPATPAPATRPLAALLQHIARHTSEAADSPPSADTAAGAAAPAAAAASSSPQPPGELKALRQFRSTWTQLGIAQQLARALAELPPNAGPLNSHRLVLNALQTLGETSPATLRHYMAYVDTLQWLERASFGTAAPVAAAPRTAARKAPARGKPG